MKKWTLTPVSTPVSVTPVSLTPVSTAGGGGVKYLSSHPLRSTVLCLIAAISTWLSTSAGAGETVAYPDVWGRDLQAYTQFRRNFSSWNADMVAGRASAYFTDDGDVALVIGVKRQWQSSSFPAKDYLLRFFSGEVAEIQKTLPAGWRAAEWSTGTAVGGAFVGTTGGSPGDCLDILNAYSFIHEQGRPPRPRMFFLLTASFPIGKETEIGGHGCEPPVPVQVPQKATKALNVSFLPLGDGSFLAWDIDRGPEVIRFDLEWRSFYRPRHIVLMNNKDFRSAIEGAHNPLERQKILSEFLVRRAQ